MQPIVCGLLMALLPVAATAQFSESFTDGDFSQNPRWQGMDTSFRVEGGMLRSSHSQPNSSFYLSTASAAALATQWEFTVHLDFSTSALNYADVFLTAETPQLEAGYFVRIGYTTDEVSLYYKNREGFTTKLIDGRDGVTNHALQLRVTRTSGGVWTLYTDGVEEGKVRDTTYMLSAWFGVMVRQSTASFFGKHFFDDIGIKPLDATPPYVPRRYDVLIHEIMADPSPTAGLPEAEYVELRNVSGKDINLGGWLLKGRSIHAVLPAYKLLADSIVVIASSSNASMFYPSLSGGSSFSISNEGELMVLYDNKGQVIHAVDFRAEWYGGGVRAQGGWSLEMKDVRWPCACAENFGPGGTPGKNNRVEENIEAPVLPRLLHVSVADAQHVRLHFSAPLDSAAASQAGRADAPLFSTLLIGLTVPMTAGTIYDLNVAGLKDCAGRGLPDVSVRYGLPQIADTGDLVFSELLFDPPQGAQDFIELYNRSTKPVELNGLYFAQRDEPGGLKPAVPLVQTPYLLMPGEYIAFSEDAVSVCRHYACLGRLENIAALPSMPQDEGTVVLLRADGLELDEFGYKKAMHTDVFHDTRGISLERLWMDKAAPEPGNWHSAASTAGYATPGYRNSRRAPETAGEEGFRLEPEKFSPDNDGHDDLAFIHWNLPAAGFTFNITVYDAEGRAVRQLAQNVMAGSSGSIGWNGSLENGMPASPGIYVIFVRAYDGEGRVKQWKSAVALQLDGK
ncbi:lamin tail domain-containing protein [Chitinophaga sp. GCM10012297]|uniref:Lamin tail domain-containing protein n=1 Tax=Chitinophaga chungangae TaxID=2821488 RepID=A0ABS3YEK2_9BACT|nr:lamin tail domain-containing protein [Chitinophaga chungangae]MBO9153110.1 lamin tail domain-containing protein [Chitinophaga chungangae]